MELTFGEMVPRFMKETSSMAKWMAMESKLGRMDNITRASISRTENMELVNSSSLLAQFIEVHSRKIKCMAKVRSSIKMDRNVKEIGRMISILAGCKKKSVERYYQDSN